MTTPQNDIQAITPASETPRRSRWQRFSPSMGWKAFWSEILIVVLGVVIALAANETVEEWSWQNKVAKGEVRVQGDVEQAFLWSAEQFTTQTCIDAQLDRLAGNLMESDSTLIPAPLYSEAVSLTTPRYVVRLSTRPWQFTAWEALLADGTATHFTPQSQQLYGYIKEVAVRQQSFRVEYDRMNGRLSALSYPMAMDAGVRSDFLVDIETLRRQRVAGSLSGVQLMSLVAGAGIAPTPESVDAFLEASGTVKFCKAHGLPLTDWRDYQKVNAGQTSAPAAPK